MLLYYFLLTLNLTYTTHKYNFILHSNKNKNENLINSMSNIVYQIGKFEGTSASFIFLITQLFGMHKFSVTWSSHCSICHDAKIHVTENKLSTQS